MSNIMNLTDQLNAELSELNTTAKCEHDEKRKQLMLKQSEIINLVINKLINIKVNQEKLNKK
jgi:hypothetical protein